MMINLKDGVWINATYIQSLVENFNDDKSFSQTLVFMVGDIEEDGHFYTRERAERLAQRVNDGEQLPGIID